MVKVSGEFKVEVGEKQAVVVTVGLEFKAKVGEKWEVAVKVGVEFKTKVGGYTVNSTPVQHGFC